jgi:methionine-rich copper-binding protein CopC
VVLAAAWLGVFLAPAAPAQAHARLVSTEPARNVVVPAAPGEVVLRFSEPVRVVPDRISGRLLRRHRHLIATTLGKLWPRDLVATAGYSLP